MQPLSYLQPRENMLKLTRVQLQIHVVKTGAGGCSASLMSDVSPIPLPLISNFGHHVSFDYHRNLVSFDS